MSAFVFPTRTVGDFTITAISDGYMPAPLELLSNVTPEDAAKIQEKAGIHPPTALHINCYLVRSATHTVLIDAGTGGMKNWGGCLPENLLRAGIQPGAIDSILLTHAHPDHIGGLITAAGEVAFPNAELVVHGKEVAFWQNDENLNRAPAQKRNNFLGARRVFDAYRKNLRLFEKGDVLPGIAALPLPGHTDGHCGYLISSQGQNLLIWADIVHFPHIQIAHPNVSIAFDNDAALAAQTRARILDQVSSDHTPIAGMHFGTPGFARIIRSNESYDIVYSANI